MSRKLHGDAGVCQCCGRVGPTWADLDAAEPEPLCDRCEYAQRRWEAWQAYITGRSYGLGYPYPDSPPKSPPIRRGTTHAPARSDRLHGLRPVL